MAYNPLNTTEIEAGDPTKQELFSKIRLNQADFDTRLEDLEAVTFSALIPLKFSLFGKYADFTGVTNMDFQRVVSNITVNAVRLIIITAGAGGTTQIDIEFKRGAGAWTSLFSTKPSVGFGSGDYAVSTNAVISTADLDAADLLRMTLDTAQSGPQGSEAEDLHVFLEFEPR